LPGLLEAGEGRAGVAGGGVLGAEVEGQEGRRPGALLELALEQLDVAARLLLRAADGAEVAVVLDAYARVLEALRVVGRQLVRDLLVDASLEAVLRPVAEDAERAVGRGRAVAGVAREVGLDDEEGLAPDAAGHRRQALDVLLHE